MGLLTITLIIAGVGLFKVVDKFYYSQIAKNITYQGNQIANLYENNPETFKNSDEINRYSHIINAHTIILNEKGVVQFCNASTHLTPGDVFKESELSRIFQGETMVKTDFYDHFDAEMLSVGIPVQKDGKVSEALLIYTPFEPISATLDSLRNLLIAISIVLIILTSILAFFLSRSLSKPLIRMNQFALGLAKGDFSHRITVRSKDEIGKLGESFNYLSGQLYENTLKERKLEEMRREFVANVSHELRTPITLIQGYAEAMTDIAESPEQLENFTKTIIDESSRLKRMVEELLELSRLESGVVLLEKELVDIEKVSAQIQSRFESAFKKNNILFQSEISGNAKSVWVDRFRFEQILINLIDNGIRYAPGGFVELSSRKSEKGIEIRVSDTGKGIEAEDIPYVFERFYRVDKSRNRESGGTGLGLSIVKNLVEAHGGTIKVESIPKVKTEFIMVFPDS